MKLTKNLSKFKESKLVAILPDFKKEKTQKISTLIFSFIALSFFGLFAIEPTLSTIAKLNKELDDSKFVDRKLSEKISNLSTLQSNYSLIQNDIPTVLAAVPENPELPTLIGQIQAVAQETNVTINSVQSFEVEAANSTDTKKDFHSFSFSVEAQGAYENLNNFLNKLTSMQRVVTIDELLISRKGSTGNLELNMKGKAYFKY